MSYALDTTLVASRTDTANVSNNAGTAITSTDLYKRGTFVLTATVNSGSPTLDVSIQTLIGNTTWVEIARFTQVSTTITRVIHNVGGVDNATSVIEEVVNTAPSIRGDTITGAKRPGPISTQLRAIWTIASAGSITWSLIGTLFSH